MVRNSPFIFCIFVLLRNPMFFCMWFWWMQSFFNAVIKFVVTKHKIQRNSLPTIKLKKGILTGLFQIDPQPPSNFSVIPHGRMFNLNCVIQIEQDSELEGNNDHIFGWIMNLPQSPVQKPRSSTTLIMWHVTYSYWRGFPSSTWAQEPKGGWKNNPKGRRIFKGK